MRTIKEALEDGSLSLEDEIDYADMTEEDYKKEIERLNNIINELEKYLYKMERDIEKEIHKARSKNDDEEVIRLNREFNIFELVLDKLQELKGSDNNE